MKKRGHVCGYDERGKRRVGDRAEGRREKRRRWRERKWWWWWWVFNERCLANFVEVINGRWGEAFNEKLTRENTLSLSLLNFNR